jgi:hypothetical protein
MKDASAPTGGKNYYEQTKGEAATSKYIQPNTPPPTGDGYAAKPITGTPDDVLIKPNLKTSTCETKTFTLPIFFGHPIPIPFIVTPDKKEIKEPTPTGEKAEYGKIHVNQTKSGFVEIRDETKGNKRKISIHPTGTYSQVLDNGDMQEKVVHDRMIIIDKNWNISVGEDEVIVIMGNQKIQIKKDRKTNITGDDNLNVAGNSATVIAKDRGMQIDGGNVQTIGKDSLIDITGNGTENVKKDFKHTVNGSETNIVQKDRTDAVLGNLTIVVTGNAIVHAKNANVSADQKIAIAAPKIDMTGAVTIFGSLSVV